MGNPKNLRTLIIGKLKDKASQSKASIIHVMNPKTRSLHLSLLRATTHDIHTPPKDTHLAALLSSGHHAAAVAKRRLRATRDASVAMKSLIIIHHLFKQGHHHQFWTGGKNCLKLNRFIDNSSFVTLELSPWVRWYALYLESLLSASRVLGSFPNLTASSKENSIEKDDVSLLNNRSILNQTGSLVGLLEETSQRPEAPPLFRNKIIDETRELVASDHFSVMRLVMVRLDVLNQRLIGSKMSCDDSGELTRVLMRLENCKASLLRLTRRYRILVQDFWDMVGKVEDEVWDRRKMLVDTKRLTFVNGQGWDTRFG